MDSEELAVARFQEGFSCSQAVFSPYAEAMGLDKNTALKIAGTVRVNNMLHTSKINARALRRNDAEEKNKKKPCVFVSLHPCVRHVQHVFDHYKKLPERLAEAWVGRAKPAAL
jgi:hypothetical protein